MDSVSYSQIENLTVAEAINFMAAKEKQRVTWEFEQAKQELAQKFRK
jgi:hypothetical protein